MQRNRPSGCGHIGRVRSHLGCVAGRTGKPDPVRKTELPGRNDQGDVVERSVPGDGCSGRPASRTHGFDFHRAETASRETGRTDRAKRTAGQGEEASPLHTLRNAFALRPAWHTPQFVTAGWLFASVPLVLRLA